MVTVAEDDLDPDRAELRVIRLLIATLGLLFCFALFVAVSIGLDVREPSATFAAGAVDSCPSVMGSIGKEIAPPCRSEAAAGRQALLKAIGACVGLLVCLGLAVRKHRRLVRGSGSDLDAPTDEWAHDNMRWEFWIALMFFVALAAGSTLAAALTPDDLDRRMLSGVVLWWCCVAATVRYGRTRAFHLSIVGSELRWSAPLRARSVPLAALTRIEVFFRSSLLGGGGVARFLTADGEMAVRLPDRRHHRRLLGLVATLSTRVPGLDVREGAPDPSEL